MKRLTLAINRGGSVYEDHTRALNCHPMISTCVFNTLFQNLLDVLMQKQKVVSDKHCPYLNTQRSDRGGGGLACAVAKPPVFKEGCRLCWRRWLNWEDGVKGAREETTGGAEPPLTQGLMEGEAKVVLGPGRVHLRKRSSEVFVHLLPRHSYSCADGDGSMRLRTIREGSSGTRKTSQRERIHAESTHSGCN